MANPQVAQATRPRDQVPLDITITFGSARPSMRTSPLIQGTSIEALFSSTAKAALLLRWRSAVAALDCGGRPQLARGRGPCSVVEGSAMLALARHRALSGSLLRGPAPQDKGAPGGSAESAGVAVHCAIWWPGWGGPPGGVPEIGKPPPATSPRASPPGRPPPADLRRHCPLGQGDGGTHRTG